MILPAVCLVFPAVLEHNEYCISDLIAFNAKVMRVCLGVNIDKWLGSAVDINCLPPGRRYN